MILMGSDSEGRTTVHNGGGYVRTIERPITRHTDLTRLPRRGSYAVEAVKVCLAIVGGGCLIALSIQVGRWIVRTAQALGVGV